METKTREQDMEPENMEEKDMMDNSKGTGKAIDYGDISPGSHELFAQYLDYLCQKELKNIKRMVKEALVKEKFGTEIPGSGQVSRYTRSEEYTDRYPDMEAAITSVVKDRYINPDETIFSKFKRIESKALVVQESGQKVDFSNLDEQYMLAGFKPLRFGEILKTRQEAFTKALKEAIKHYFQTETQYVLTMMTVEEDDTWDGFDEYEYDPQWESPSDCAYDYVPVEEDTFDRYLEMLSEEGVVKYLTEAKEYTRFSETFFLKLLLPGQEDPDGSIRKRLDTILENKAYRKKAFRELKCSGCWVEAAGAADAYFTEDIVTELIFSNQNYVEMGRSITEKKNAVMEEIRKRDEERRQSELMREEIRKNIVRRIPENIKDLFPAARQMHRHFILHIGPTNSGKTFAAIQAMSQEENGIYLAPLRLLAYEKYEDLNKGGVPCSMLTGEECLEKEGSRHLSATVEMLPLEKQFACAVIDEAQMLADRNRGGAWLQAILGVQAEQVHVCMAPEAESIVVSLVEACGDSYTIERHERLTSLSVEADPFFFPASVRKGDALIVFSRRNVHAVARELQDKGIKCSILYGNLPHDVRHSEAGKFASGETDVVVATDCIGMGMNLPVRRVVFLEIMKYDGSNTRKLTPGEVKQIAGRAGRQGMFEEGFVTSTSGNKALAAAVSAPVEQIKDAAVSFPEALAGIEGKLSEIIIQWNHTVLPDMFKKEFINDLYGRASSIESYYPDIDKWKEHQLISIPFDQKNSGLKTIWKKIALEIAGNKEADIESHIPSLKNMGKNYTSADLATLETYSQTCDLLYSFCRKFGFPQYMDQISATRETVSAEIMKVLSRSKLQKHKCKTCGRILPWNYGFGMCRSCYSKRHKRLACDDLDELDF